MYHFRSGCKSTGRLNRETDLITPLSQHDHNIGEYRSDVFNLKRKCKKTAIYSQTNLWHVFDDTTRCDPCACEVTFPGCESAMYRARKKLQPKVPSDSVEFCEMLPVLRQASHRRIVRIFTPNFSETHLWVIPPNNIPIALLLGHELASLAVNIGSNFDRQI